MNVVKWADVEQAWSEWQAARARVSEALTERVRLERERRAIEAYRRYLSVRDRFNDQTSRRVNHEQL